MLATRRRKPLMASATACCCRWFCGGCAWARSMVCPSSVMTAYARSTATRAAHGPLALRMPASPTARAEMPDTASSWRGWNRLDLAVWPSTLCSFSHCCVRAASAFSSSCLRGALPLPLPAPAPPLGLRCLACAMDAGVSNPAFAGAPTSDVISVTAGASPGRAVTVAGVSCAAAPAGSDAAADAAAAAAPAPLPVPAPAAGLAAGAAAAAA